MIAGADFMVIDGSSSSEPIEGIFQLETLDLVTLHHVEASFMVSGRILWKLGLACMNYSNHLAMFQ